MFDTAVAFNRSLNGWNVSSVKNMRHMFHQADDLNQSLGGWDVIPVADMFKGATLSTVNYGALLLGWNVQGLNSNTNLSFNAGSSQCSSSSQPLRDVLAGAFNWKITDGGVQSIILPAGVS